MWPTLSSAVGLYLRATLANGTSAPYVTLIYNDATYYDGRMVKTSPADGATLNPGAAQVFKWYIEGAGDPTPLTQQSAVFHWRATDGSTAAKAWHSVNISGNTQQVSIPAKTFPQGRTIEYYITAVDELNRTLSAGSASDPYTVVMQAVKPVPTAPANGISVDPTKSLAFSWTLASTGGTTYAQDWANIRWTDDPNNNDKSTWNSIAVTTAKSYTVPAYTFPPNKTIRWTILADATETYPDSIGWYSDTVRSFTTLAYSLAITQQPSGSNLSTRSAIQVKYTLNTSAGTAVAQTGSKLYWRQGTSGAYNVITNSTATKTLTIPADTLPTSSTIQWYIEVTAQDGSVYTTSPASFTTAQPKIQMLTYPSGSNNNYGAALQFTWKFTANGVDYPQASATFYWRANTTDSWTAVQASGSTQSVTIPAYTFAAGKTIYWYVSGTETGGTQSQTSQASFSTCTPSISVQSGPTSGYADPRNAIRFAWLYSYGSYVFQQTAAVFHWRIQGASSWNNSSISGDTKYIDIAANTFPVASMIEWYVEGTARGNASSQTAVFTFSTTAATAYAVCQEPVGQAVDGTKEITFRWIVNNTDGSEPSRTILSWKLPTESASQWHVILDTAEAVYAYTVPDDFFAQAGPVDWRVVAYNRDGVAGPESVASFVVIKAPDAPEGLTATAVPITTISWQASGQEAYEITIDGEVVKKAYGSSVYEYTVREPLADGLHAISVRVQGAYGLWSNPATTSVDVLNVPQGAVSLAGVFDTDAELSWAYEGSALTNPVIAVYRDGVWIGTANGKTEFADRFALGEHDYRVEYWAGGYYTPSNTVTGSMSVRSLKIAEFNGGEWMDLRLSENSARTQGFRWSRTSSAQHITAAVFPVLEMASYEDLNGSFDCAFADPAEARRFERFKGKIVILKCRDGSVLIGGLTEMQKSVNGFYIAYSFSLQQIHWEDFVT